MSPVAVTEVIEKGGFMPSNKRVRYRENKKKRKLEENLSKKNDFGFNDPTAYKAVKNIVRQQKKRGETDKYRSD